MPGAGRGGGRFLHTTFRLHGQSFDRYYGLVALGDRGFQVLATVEHDHFAETAPDLQQIVESFRLPPETLTAAVPPDLETAPAGEVTGVSVAYHLTAPTPRWHLRKAAEAAKDQPLADRWWGGAERGRERRGATRRRGRRFLHTRVRVKGGAASPSSTTTGS